uniref:Uncharacterized protein n=1 Tax=Lepeophtheirus salmonis TaxID=72036 RepID=A0A0K2T7Z9_LEPSM
MFSISPTKFTQYFH